MYDSLWLHGPQSTRLLSPWNSPGKNTGVGSHSLLQGIFLTQGLNLHLLHCRQILHHLSRRESPRGVKPFVNSCSDSSDLCTYSGLHSHYTASLFLLPRHWAHWRWHLVWSLFGAMRATGKVPGTHFSELKHTHLSRKTHVLLSPAQLDIS